MRNLIPSLILPAVLALAVTHTARAQEPADTVSADSSAFVVPASAEPRHMCFMHVEIKGDPASFFRQLRRQGFGKPRGNSTRGTFAGVENTVVAVDTTAITKTVYRVSAHFPSMKNWEKTLRRYDDLKANVSSLYDDPGFTEESFASPYRMGDGFEIKALENGKCTYHCVWEIRYAGTITLDIVPDRKEKGVKVVLTYEDAAGAALAAEENRRKYINDL